MGFSGGGDALTSTQLATIKATAHISGTVATLSDQLGTSDTDLTASLEMGSFGARQERFDNTTSSASTDTTSTATTDSTDSTTSTTDSTTTRPTPTPHITVTGTTNPNSVSTDGSDLNITSGKTIDGTSSDLVALVGSSLATKNSLKVGSTFTAYSKTITVVGIFKTSNTFQDSGLIMPLATVQTLSDQAGSISSVIATVDSSDNVSKTVTTLKSSLGTKADIVSETEQAAASVSSLKSIESLTLYGVIGATIAGAVIVLLAMIMIVRERRHEIGVIKAIGGTNVKVIGQFITEALTLTIIGAIVGLSLGILVSGPMTSSLVSNSSRSSSTSSRSTGGAFGGTGTQFREAMRGGFNQISNNLTEVKANLTPAIFASAVGITLLIAIIGSAVPAWFIARIRPAEVLRTE
jgi:putative ABC transport system permease protein